MKTKITTGIIVFGLILMSCNQKGAENPAVNYSDKTVLDSIIKATPHSQDTLFLGFTIGMDKSEYKNHIKKLRSEGKNIEFSKSKNLSNIAGTFNIGPGYTFKTKISTTRGKKTFTGEGSYFLEPVYNKGGALIMLNVVPVEKWNGDYGYNTPKWLEDKIKENSEPVKDEALKKVLIDNDFVGEHDLLRQKENVIINKNTLYFNYIDLKTLLTQVWEKEIEKEIIEVTNEDVKF